jgi:hypothetical protein
MPLQRGSSTLVTWSEQRDATSLSLDQFKKQTWSLLECIVMAKPSLERAYAPFKRSEGIRPVQCMVALKALAEVNECVEQFCAWLYDTRQLTLAIIALPHRFIVALHQIEEQTRQLICLTQDFRTACIKPSQKTTRQCQEIYYAFAALMQFIKDLLLQSDHVYGDKICLSKGSRRSFRNDNVRIPSGNRAEKKSSEGNLIYIYCEGCTTD